MILLHRNAVLWLYTAISGRDAKYEGLGDQIPSPSAAQIARKFLRSNSWKWDGLQHYRLINDILDLIQAAECDTQAIQAQDQFEQAKVDLLKLARKAGDGGSDG